MKYLTGFLFYVFKWMVVIALFGGFIYWMNKEKDDRETEAQAKLQPYNSQVERYLKKNSIAKNPISAQGNVVFINEKTKKVDKFSDYTISPYNQPNGPLDVDSVVLHDCEYVQVGSYTNGSKATQHVCNFTVIDVASGTWSNWGEFKGTMPPEEIKRKRGSTSDESGGRAIDSFFRAGGLVTRQTPSQ